jgi:hypothetical protein
MKERLIYNNISPHIEQSSVRDAAITCIELRAHATPIASHFNVRKTPGTSFSNCNMQHASRTIHDAEIYKRPASGGEKSERHHAHFNHMGSMSTRSFQRSVCLSNGTLQPPKSEIVKNFFVAIANKKQSGAPVFVIEVSLDEFDGAIGWDVKFKCFPAYMGDHMHCRLHGSSRSSRSSRSGGWFNNQPFF